MKANRAFQTRNGPTRALCAHAQKTTPKMIKYPMTMIPKMIENTHFHKKHPENKNIKITNKKDKFIKVYNGKKWVYDNKANTIKNLIDDKYTILDIYYDEKGSTKMENN